jgi:N-acylglucosamine-6-phosphate 2-epimerase
MAAMDAGADAVATTLSGYTPATAHRAAHEPDWDLLASLVTSTQAPVIVEGHVWTFGQAARAVEMGAFAVVVGTAITRPRVITRSFVERLRSVHRLES